MPNPKARRIPASPAALLVLLALSVGGCAVHVESAHPPQEHKTLVCHKGKKTLEISEAALDAHLGHGDSLGPCL